MSNEVNSEKSPDRNMLKDTRDSMRDVGGKEKGLKKKIRCDGIGHLTDKTGPGA